MGSSSWSRIIGSVSQHLDYRNMLAGIFAGVTATLVLHPLELVKVRMQVDEGGRTRTSNGKAGPKVTPARPQYSGVVSALKSIYKSEGGVRSLYQGVTPNIWGSGASWGLYFLFYNALKSVMATQLVDGGATKLPTHVHLISAFLAGASTSILTNPIWMMKTRLCLQYKSDRFEKSLVDPSGKSTKLIHYNGMIDGLYKVIKHEGFMSLYKGISFGILGTLHGVIQFGVYEKLKQNHQILIGRAFSL